MGSTRPQNEGEAYLLPSTFSPWRNDEPTDPTYNNNITPSTLADPARRSIDSVAPPHLARSIVSDDGTSIKRRASSAFYSPQSLDIASPTTIPESSTPRDYPQPPQIPMFHSRSTVSASTADTAGSFSSLGGSGLASLADQQGNIPAVSVLTGDARRSAAIMPTHPGAESFPMSAMYNPAPSPSIMVSEEDGDADSLTPRYAKAHLGCYSRQDVYIKRWSWLYITLVFLSLYSTALSGLWLVVSIFQPQYGRSVSTGNGWQLTPSTATLLATLAAKTIELSFVTVFVAVLGQVLTRRAFSRLSRGVTLAEMTMRNWVIQPGSLLTYWEGIPNAATTFLGALTLTATVCALFYTTASDAMVSPKLKRQGWDERDLQGLVKASYANPYYVRETCQTPLRSRDPEQSSIACLDIVFSGQSYQSLITFMAEWDEIHQSRNSTARQLSRRPTGKHNLFDNTTMDSSWIETEYGDMTANFNAHKRVINNVTLAMPHAGVYAAATDPINGILQPSELLGLGEYSIRASVVSPVVNVMCVNMNEDELAPLVYTQWPNARTEATDIPGQRIGVADWDQDVPIASATEWLNRTVVDDIFRWGKKYGRWPPVFPLYPNDHNMLTNATIDYSGSLYILAKAGNLNDYTLCDLRSWMTSKCSTAFDLSGTSGGHMKAHCEDPGDANTYARVNPMSADGIPSSDWLNLAREWGLSINLNGGVQNNNASNARVLTSLILDSAALDPHLPSIAEAIAVLASSTIVTGSIDSTFASAWAYGGDMLMRPEGVYETFSANVQTQQYASAHTASWQAIFYPILGLTFLINVFCLLYLIFGTALTSFSADSSPSRTKKPASSLFAGRLSPLARRAHGPVARSAPESDGEDDEGAGEARGAHWTGGKSSAKGLVTDYTEPQNLFALAVNSPPTRAFAGSCGHGPDACEMAVSWRVRYAAGANHYFFDADNNNYHAATSSGADLPSVGNDGRYGQSYKRLSSRFTWL